MELVLELQDLLLKEYVGRSVLLFLGNWRLVLVGSVFGGTKYIKKVD